MKLLIGNKNYSSWSLRPWLALKHFEVPFEEEQLLLNGPGWKQAMLEQSPTGRVPVLIDGDLRIVESLAIIEYVADLVPERDVWPRDRELRALARSAAAEMHSGFTALRAAAPMNLRASHPNKVSLDSVAADLKRIETIWGDLLQRSGGPFLGGSFCGADAMFAPVATRIRTYALPVPDFAAEYVEAIYALLEFQEWLAAALREAWVVDDDEIDVIRARGQAALPEARGQQES